MIVFGSDYYCKMNRSRKMANAVLSVSAIVFLSKILGLIKQMVTANAFGATFQTDVISLAQGLITNFDYAITQALITAFIPTYIHLRTKGDRNGDKFFCNTVIVFFCFSVLVSFLLFVFSNSLATILAPSYDPEQTIELGKYVRVITPILPLIIQLAIFNSLLRSNERFTPGEFTSLNQSLITIFLVFMFANQFGANTLVLSFFSYSIINLAYLVFLSRKLWRFEVGAPFSDPDVRKMIRMMGPLLIGYAMVFINQQIDRAIVSGFEEGSVTAMSYAAVLSNFITTFIGSLCAIFFTYVTKGIAEKRDDEVEDFINNTTVQMITLLLPICIITVMNTKDIIKLVYGRGMFDDKAIQNSSFALFGYGFMFIPFALRELFSRFQYAHGDSRRPMINSSISIIINIVLSIILGRIIGLIGVTVATSISVLVCAVLNIISSRRRALRVKIRFSDFVRWLIGGLICFSVCYWGNKLLVEKTIILRLACIIGISVIGYVSITYSIIIPMIKNLLHRNSTK